MRPELPVGLHHVERDHARPDLVERGRPVEVRKVERVERRQVPAECEEPDVRAVHPEEHRREAKVREARHVDRIHEPVDCEAPEEARAVPPDSDGR